jgi:hypothetical protein
VTLGANICQELGHTNLLRRGNVTVMAGWGWPSEWACRDLATDLFFDPALENEARAVCSGCPARIPCLWRAIDQHLEHGIYGGWNSEERQGIALGLAEGAVMDVPASPLAPKFSLRRG